MVYFPNYFKKYLTYILQIFLYLQIFLLQFLFFLHLQKKISLLYQVLKTLLHLLNLSFLQILFDNLFKLFLEKKFYSYNILFSKKVNQRNFL